MPTAETTRAPDGDTSDLSLRRFWPLLALSSVLSLVTAVTDGLTIAALASRLVGEVPGMGASDGTIDIAAFTSTPALLALVAATFALNYANTELRVRATADWNAARRRDLIHAYRLADHRTQASYSGAQLSSSVDQIGRASQSIGSVIGLINSAVRTVIYVGIAVVASWQVSIVCLVAGGALVLALRTLSRRTRQMHRSMSGKYIKVGEDIGELATSARELHLLNRWDHAEDDLGSEIEHVRHLEARSGVLSGMVGPIYWSGTVLVGLAVAIFAGLSGSSTSSLATAGMLLLRSLNAAQAAQVMYQSYNDTVPYVEQVRGILATLRLAERRPSVLGPGPGLVLAATALRLSYGNDTVVRDVSVSLDGTGGVALVGPSGSGKSTTLGALGGLLAPEAGVVTFNGVALGDLPSSALNSSLGVLPQDPRLIRDTLRANLTRPDTDIADERLWEILDAVGLTDTVTAFDDGLDTDMGRLGEGLSGGELQRLGLARLIVNQPTVWLLDEPTSALDRRNSERVSSLIADAMAEHLVVLVTHRPELLAACRQVVVIIDGRLVDQGPVAEVARRQPFLEDMLEGHDIEPDIQADTESPDRSEEIDPGARPAGQAG